MYKKIVVAVFFLMTFSLTAQNKKTEPNYSFIKLVITNSSNEVLLVKWRNDWEIQGRKFAGDFAMKEFVKSMAKSVGIKVKDIKLRGLFTFHFEGYHKPTLMHYYQASYVSGTIKPPPSCSDVAWVPIDQSLEKMAYKDMKAIMKRIFKDKSVWGGALVIREKSKDNPRDFKLRTNFYKF
ncbi:hypothetical protein [uncultured Tenacibaculum sp.]|uniref:hypothetical protein n=1 Tax=uncultured Tenacibaculum sp. TaxID=174713 RepID=UPI00261CF70D|nr:hypothetical protein [uncultured Tenacibaculum sp.]